MIEEAKISDSGALGGWKRDATRERKLVLETQRSIERNRVPCRRSRLPHASADFTTLRCIGVIARKPTEILLHNRWVSRDLPIVDRLPTRVAGKILVNLHQLIIRRRQP